MVDPLTTNMQLAVPTRGSDVGTWDTPVNGDFTILDGAFGGVTTIALTSASVTLATSQAQNNIIRLTGTLTANVAITMTSIYKFWTIDNQLTNSPSSFAATLVSTSGASIIGCPPGTTDVFYDATTMNYKNMGKIGEYWDYAGATVPTWVTASTKPPWLNCNGTTFSSATYPILANLLGTTTLVDSKGRSRAALNQGSSRITSSNSGLDGNTIFSGGGTESITLGTSQIPAHSHGVTDPGHTHGHNANSNNSASTTGGGGFLIPAPLGATINAAVTGISIQNAGGGGAHINVQPTYIGGITMIRAA